jgi:hypothetical protein
MRIGNNHAGVDCKGLASNDPFLHAERVRPTIEANFTAGFDILNTMECSRRTEAPGSARCLAAARTSGGGGVV